MHNKSRLLVFASGGRDGGGSGFENLVKKLTAGDIVGVVSNYENGGVRERANRLDIPFRFFSGPYTKENYREMVNNFKPDFIALSGWNQLTRGLNPTTTINIHPGPLPQFGGKGMYSHFLHEAVLDAYHEGAITHSEVNIHFVTDEYDRGPVIFKKRAIIKSDDTPDTLFRRVNDIELEYQPIVTDALLRGEIYWDGENMESVQGFIEK